MNNFGFDEGEDEPTPRDMDEQLRRFRRELGGGNKNFDGFHDAQALETLIPYCLDKQLFNDALTFSTVLIEYQPFSADAWLWRGVALSNLERFDEAMESFDRAMSLDPTDNEIQLHRADVFAERGEYERAWAIYEDILHLQSDDEEALYGKALLLGRMNRVDEAMNLLKYLQKSEERGLDATAELAYCYDQKHEYDKAFELYQQCIDEDPFDAIHWFNAGVVLCHQQQFYKAIEYYDIAVTLKPEFSAAWYNLGNSYGTLGRLIEAIYAYEQALEFERTDFAFWHNLGSAYHETNQPQKAVEAFQQALAIEPHHFESLYGLAASYDGIGKPDKALEYYLQAEQLQPQDADLLYAIADVYYTAKNVEQSLAYYEKALRTNPRDPDGIFDYAATLFDEMMYSEAAQWFEKFIELRPDNYEGYYFLAKCLLMLGDKQTPIGLLQKALFINPELRTDLRKDINSLPLFFLNEAFFRKIEG